MERENSLENTFRKGKKGSSSFYRQEILLSEFFKLRPNVFHWDRGKHAGLVFPEGQACPFVAPFSMPASARRRRRQQLPLSRRETFFKVPFRANDHQGLFLSPMRNAARVENPAGRLFFPRHPPTFSSLPSLSLSLSPPTRTRTNITGLKYVS